MHVRQGGHGRWALCGGLVLKVWADGARPVPVTPQDAARCDGHGRQQLVQLIVVADGKGDVARLEGSALSSLGPRSRETPPRDTLRLQSTSLSVVFLALAATLVASSSSSDVQYSVRVGETRARVRRTPSPRVRAPPKMCSCLH